MNDIVGDILKAVIGDVQGNVDASVRGEVRPDVPFRPAGAIRRLAANLPRPSDS